MRLLTKHMLLTVAPIAVLGTALFFIAAPAMRSQVERKAHQSLEVDAYHQATQVEAFFRARISEIRTIAASPLIRDPDRRMRYLGAEQARLANYYEGIHWDTPNGYVVTPEGKTAYIGDRAYYARVLRGDETVGDEVVSRVTGNEVFIIVVPVRDAQNRIMGGVAGKITPDSVLNTVLNPRQTGDRFIALQDAHQRTIAISPLLGQAGSHTPLAGRNSGRYDKIDENRYHTFRYPLKELGWTVVAGGSLVEASAPFVEAMRQFGMIFVVVMCGGLLVAGVAARISSRPIEELHRAMIRYEEGARTERVKVNGPLEIRWLSERFNTLADKVNREHSALEETKLALEESQIMLEGVIENSPAAIYAKDLEGRYILANRKCRAIMEVSIDPIGKTDEEVFPSIAKTLRENDQLVISSGTPLIFEEEAVLNDGVEPYLSAKFVVCRPSGDPYAVAGISTSIGELRRTERALADREAFLASVLECLPLELICTDAKGVSLFESKVSIHNLGSLCNQILTDSYILSPDWKAALVSALEGNETYSEVSDTTTQKPTYVRRYVSPVRAGEKIIGTISVNVDLTELKRYQSEILQLNAELEDRVRKRTEQLSIANADLESFTYRVSHDLRSPLRAIAGFTQILCEGFGQEIPGEAQDSVNRILAACKRMNLLIEDLLNLSRIGHRPLKLARVNVHEVAKDVLRQLVEQLPSLDADIVVNPMGEVIGDEGLLRQIYANLLDNALKFSGNVQSTRIELGNRQTVNGSAYYVQDNGIGFPSDQAQRIFRPFERLHSQTEFPGTGIGLATVLRIAEAHGGRAWAEGKSGEGATFYFTLGDPSVAQSI